MRRLHIIWLRRSRVSNKWTRQNLHADATGFSTVCTEPSHPTTTTTSSAASAEILFCVNHRSVQRFLWSVPGALCGSAARHTYLCVRAIESRSDSTAPSINPYRQYQVAGAGSRASDRPVLQCVRGATPRSLVCLPVAPVGSQTPGNPSLSPVRSGLFASAHVISRILICDSDLARTARMTLLTRSF